MSIGHDKSFVAICSEIYRPRKHRLLIQPRHSDECVSLNVVCCMAAGIVVHLMGAGQAEIANAFLQTTQRDMVLLLQKKGGERAQEQFVSRLNIFMGAWSDLYDRGGEGSRLASYFAAMCTTSRPDVTVDDLVPDPAFMRRRSDWLTDHGREVLKKTEGNPRVVHIPIASINEMSNLQILLIEMLSEVMRRMSEA